MQPSTQTQVFDTKKIFLALVIFASVIAIICSQKKANEYGSSKDGCYGFPQSNAKKLAG